MNNLENFYVPKWCDGQEEKWVVNQERWLQGNGVPLHAGAVIAKCSSMEFAEEVIKKWNESPAWKKHLSEKLRLSKV